MPVPAAPPPGATLQKAGRGRDAPSRRARQQPSRPTPPRLADVAKLAGDQRAEPTPRSTGTNDLLAFLTFVEHHQPGSSVNAIVENYSSHGAYVRIGDVKGYVPLSLMSDPPPRSAREFMKIGESITLVVESFAPARRSIDLAIPTMATVKMPPADAPSRPSRSVPPKVRCQGSRDRRAGRRPPTPRLPRRRRRRSGPRRRRCRCASGSEAEGARQEGRAAATAGDAGRADRRSPSLRPHRRQEARAAQIACGRRHAGSSRRAKVDRRCEGAKPTRRRAKSA